MKNIYKIRLDIPLCSICGNDRGSDQCEDCYTVIEDNVYNVNFIKRENENDVSI